MGLWGIGDKRKALQDSRRIATQKIMNADGAPSSEPMQVATVAIKACVKANYSGNTTTLYLFRDTTVNSSTGEISHNGAATGILVKNIVEYQGVLDELARGDRFNVRGIAFHLHNASQKFNEIEVDYSSSIFGKNAGKTVHPDNYVSATDYNTNVVNIRPLDFDVDSKTSVYTEIVNDSTASVGATFSIVFEITEVKIK